jgi:hypothetical protein
MFQTRILDDLEPFKPVDDALDDAVGFSVSKEYNFLIIFVIFLLL